LLVSVAVSFVLKIAIAFRLKTAQLLLEFLHFTLSSGGTKPASVSSLQYKTYLLRSHNTYLGLARTVYTHHIYAPHMTVRLMIFLPKILCMHRIYIGFWPATTHMPLAPHRTCSKKTRDRPTAKQAKIQKVRGGICER